MVKATIYTAPKCPHSENLKKFLSENGVEYDEIDVTKNPNAFDDIYQKTQQKGIPVIIVDNEVFVGFDRRTERRLNRSLGG